MASQQTLGETPSKKQEASHNGEAEMHSKSNDLLRDTLEEFRERGDDVKTLMKEYVKEKPMKALGIALFTGMALAFFLKR